MNTTDRYAKMTQDQFDGILAGILDGMTAEQILAIPGAYEVFSEELNNDVLEMWEQDHPFDEDAPKVGDLVFDPNHRGIALQPACATVAEVYDREGISTYSVRLNSDDWGDPVSIEFYDEAWFLADEYLEDQGATDDSSTAQGSAS